jgi:translation initiation factor IF-3
LGHILPCRAREAQKRCRKSIGYQVDRDFEGRQQRRERVGQECLEQLEHEAQKIVVLEQGGCVEHTASDVVKIETCERVYGAGVAADATKTC